MKNLRKKQDFEALAMQGHPVNEKEYQMMKPMIRFGGMLNLIVIAILSVSLRAQSGPAELQAASSVSTGSQSGGQKAVGQEKPRTVYESATVLKAVSRLVVVDVVATNKKGEHITGLTTKDFTLLEDGAPQSIRFFSFQGEGNPAQAAAPTRRLPGNVFTNVPDYTPGGALNVILLD